MCLVYQQKSTSFCYGEVLVRNLLICCRFCLLKKQLPDNEDPSVFAAEYPGTTGGAIHFLQRPQLSWQFSSIHGPYVEEKQYFFCLASAGQSSRKSLHSLKNFN